MANVVLSCAKCASELGCFRNSWIGIGNSYFSPIYPPVTFLNGFEATGDVFAKGQDGSAVQNSVLQDLACRQCATVVGLRCDDAPAGHILKKNQLILRLTEMHVVSEETGEKATVSVQQKIPLVAPGTKKAVRRAATLQPMPRHQTPSFLNQEVQARPVSGTMQPPPKPSQRIDVPRSSTRLEDAIKSQQRDIDRISGAVARIEKDMDSFQEFMVEMRAELEANRVTRKTQQESNREQLAWLQEDLNELRQENGEFQQDLREEELPDIKNKLEQLQQEIDSQGHITGLPNEDRPPASVNEFQREVLYIRRKCNQVDGVKAELQRLQKRLNDMEGKRRNSFVFPRTLMTPNQPSHAGSRMTSMPTIAQQRPRMMLQAPEDDGAQSRRTRHISPSRNPPGAFSDSIVESGPTSGRMTTQAATITATSSARTRRTTGRQDIANVAETATPKPLITQRWSYTGFRHWKTLRAAFEAFELEYPKLGIPESAKILEDHVNNSNLQSTAFASQYGEVTIVEERNENVEHRDPSESNHLETSPLKRKHGQVEGNTEELASGAIKKKRGHTSRTGEKQPTDPDQILRSPRLTTSSPRLSIPEHRVVGLISSDEGSPELGRDSPFSEVPSELANSDHIPRNEYDEGNVDRIAPPAQSNVSNEEKAKPVHQHRRSRDQLGVLPLNTVPITPASRSRNTGSSPNTNALLMTLESNEAVIPGAFPSYLTDEDVAPNAGPSGVKTDAIVYDPRTDSSKHFRCGSCGKKYRNPTALKYHKQHSSCDDDPNDSTPTKFKCPTCSVELSYGGLMGHLTNKSCGISSGGQPKYLRVATEQNKSRMQNAAVDKEQKRRDKLAARERFVRETLEREL